MLSIPTRLQSRGRALLTRLVRAHARERLGPLLELRGRERSLTGGLQRSTTRTDAVESHLRVLDAELPRPPFHADMTIDQAWSHHSGAPALFAQHHLPACDSCAVRFDETLEEAASAYGIELDRFLEELNSLLTGR